MTTWYYTDPDVSRDYEVTGDDLDFAPTVTTPALGSPITCEWLTVNPAATTRTLRIPLYGLPRGDHPLRLVVPGGNDVNLGIVSLS